MSMTSTPDNRVSDATAQNWVDHLAPLGWRPYLRLARIDRPIGTWLLLWPCFWSIALAARETQATWPNLTLLLLFATGALVMRGAGCTYNDIVDRDLDAKVKRTSSRPIPSGAISLKAAWLFLIAQCAIGLLVVISFNAFAILLGLASLVLVAIYPFMKRITYWPQFFLGLTFSWGALLGWAAVTGSLDWAPILLYLGSIAWTLGYDTIYAYQDKEDDALVGIHSTAIKFGDATKRWLWLFYIMAIMFFGAAGAILNLGWLFYLGLTAAAAHLTWQITILALDDPSDCLRVFRSNRDFGAIVFLAIMMGVRLN
ncbi:MAG: 4-hydroxybenzoate octaprenyltransferase [Alphaproteobacteria bacterium]|nr:MAG: 4-hydroxybenzoate octaprenyltransferase [Alphaproteobacteria bacterium]